MRICLANLLLFMSLYLLYPVLPVMMASRLGVPVSQTGVIFILFTLAMFFIGPFHAYLVDVYKRKYICMLSFGVMVAATAGYTLVQNATHLLMLCIVQGLSFGMACIGTRPGNPVQYPYHSLSFQGKLYGTEI